MREEAKSRTQRTPQPAGRRTAHGGPVLYAVGKRLRVGSGSRPQAVGRTAGRWCPKYANILFLSQMSLPNCRVTTLDRDRKRCGHRRVRFQRSARNDLVNGFPLSHIGADDPDACAGTHLLNQLDFLFWASYKYGESMNRKPFQDDLTRGSTRSNRTSRRGSL